MLRWRWAPLGRRRSKAVRMALATPPRSSRPVSPISPEPKLRSRACTLCPAVHPRKETGPEQLAMPGPVGELAFDEHPARGVADQAVFSRRRSRSPRAPATRASTEPIPAGSISGTGATTVPITHPSAVLEGKAGLYTLHNPSG